MADEKKISTIDVLLMVMVAVSADIAEIILDASALNDFGLMAIADFTLVFWLKMKGAKVGWVIGGGIIELIPGIDALPTRTIVLIIAIYVANHPNKLTDTAEKMTSGAKK